MVESVATTLAHEPGSRTLNSFDVIVALSRTTQCVNESRCVRMLVQMDRATFVYSLAIFCARIAMNASMHKVITFSMTTPEYDFSSMRFHRMIGIHVEFAYQTDDERSGVRLLAACQIVHTLFADVDCDNNAAQALETHGTAHRRCEVASVLIKHVMASSHQIGTTSAAEAEYQHVHNFRALLRAVQHTRIMPSPCTPSWVKYVADYCSLMITTKVMQTNAISEMREAMLGNVAFGDAIRTRLHALVTDSDVLWIHHRHSDLSKREAEMSDMSDLLDIMHTTQSSSNSMPWYADPYNRNEGGFRVSVGELIDWSCSEDLQELQELQDLQELQQLQELQELQEPQVAYAHYEDAPNSHPDALNDIERSLGQTPHMAHT